MKQVVHITEAFGGGILSMLTELCNRAATADVQVTVIYSMRQETPANFASLFHAKVMLINVSMCRSVSFKEDWKSLWVLVNSLRKCNPDVVHLHSSKAGVLGRIAARIAAPNAKLIYSPHGLSFLRRDVSLPRQLAYLSFERMADLMGGTVVACSLGELREIEDKVRAKAAVLIENGVDVAGIPTRRVRNDSQIVIGMAGRASFQKNHEAFVGLANSLNRTNVKFVWIGGEMDQLPERMRDRSISCSGWVTRARALELMSDLDIYVQTSRWEGMPLALIEAQVAGIPAVVTDVVGNRDVIIHGVTGFIASRPEEMAKYVAVLRDSQELRERMGAVAKQSASVRFSMDGIFRKWLAMYELAEDRHASEIKETYLLVPQNAQSSDE